MPVSICVLGPAGVGKTTLVERLVGKPYRATDVAPTLAADYYEYVTDGHTRIAFWDLSGDPRYAACLRLYTRRAQAILICYRAGNSESLKQALKQFAAHTHIQDQAYVVLVAIADAAAGPGSPSPRSAGQSDIVAHARARIFADTAVQPVDDGSVARLRREIERLATHVNQPATNVHADEYLSLGLRAGPRRRTRCAV